MSRFIGDFQSVAIGGTNVDLTAIRDSALNPPNSPTNALMYASCDVDSVTVDVFAGGQLQSEGIELPVAALSMTDHLVGRFTLAPGERMRVRATNGNAAAAEVRYRVVMDPIF